MHLYKTQHLSVSYGHQKVVHDVSLKIDAGEIVILMGPNGAGKSTVLKALFGLIHSTGSIELEGKKIHPTPQRMVANGVSFVPQGNTIFSNMTIEENLRMGAFHEENPISVQERLEEVMDFFPVLKRKRSDSAFAMSGGERQILALARALMTNPKLLMLDEPSIGLAPKIVQEVFDKVQQINQELGTAVLVVEHNLKSLLKIAHRGYILVQGKIAVEGPIETVADSKALEKAFFGELA